MHGKELIMAGIVKGAAGLVGNTPLLELYDQELLDKYPLWFAQFYHKPETQHNFTIWQYSESGNVPGISKPTDLNIMMLKR